MNHLKYKYINSIIMVGLLSLCNLKWDHLKPTHKINKIKKKIEYTMSL